MGQEENKSCSIPNLQNLPGALPKTRESPDAATANVGGKMDQLRLLCARISEPGCVGVRTHPPQIVSGNTAHLPSMVALLLSFFLSFFFLMLIALGRRCTRDSLLQAP